MREYIIIFLTILCSISSTDASSKEIEVSIWVNESHPPYLYTENSKAKGIYIEVLTRISERMQGYRMTFKPAPWPRVKHMIETGDEFAFVPPYYHGHDWLYVWPYSLPIMYESVVVLCRKDILKAPRPSWPDDYLGLKIANNNGFDGFGGPKFRQYVREGKITLEEAKTTERNLLKLARGRADCYMSNHLSYAWEMKRLKASGRLDEDNYHQIIKGAVISTDAVYMGFTDRDKGKFPFKRDFHLKFNNE
ncbi:substrate-binding periplasmic protein [Psychromonas ossibalaenae]|uniref:substrate-binding periplasmic protein n=1 Tax=Psychromonas ossibalaenae TaxID=444922 RepID=UPI00037782CD|nr:transporter substrate-binding domain-containing protein [Psychromonas ossibalaenae]